MSSNPVKGPSPSDPIKTGNETKASGDQHRKIERVEKVGEVDPEQQSRARKFRAMVEEDVAEETTTSKLPSPIDLFLSEDKSKTNPKASFSNQNPAQEIPSPAYSQPPKADMAPEREKKGETRLPKSKDFWQEVDEPIETHKKNTELVEKEPLEGGLKKKGEFSPSSHLGIPIREPKLTPFSERVENKEEKEELITKQIGPGSLPQAANRPPTEPFLFEEELTSPMSRFLEKEEENASFVPPPKSKKKKELEKKGAPLQGQSKEKMKTASSSQDITWSPPVYIQEEKKKETQKEEPELVVKPPSQQILPIETIPMATNAASAATPYLKPEAISLFYQMVGTIYVMQATPGVTRTEVVLNAPSYSQSKFYGATIIFEKYATAPDSFNIRLTGSNEAVSAFNQNIPTLLSAFHKGSFSFTIGRIEAEYKHERPLFRRKEKTGGNNLGSDFTDKERQ